MKTKSKISGNIVRSAAVAVLLSCAIVGLTSAFNLPTSLVTSAVPLRFSGNGPGTLNQARTLSFAERVTYQLAIEDVYWRHRIWPKDNPNPKPALDAVISQAELEKKVQDYLRDSQAFEDHWHRPITAEQLQAEMNRMAQDTKQPEVLRELFQALGDDPLVIAECLARPVLTERLLNNQYEKVDREPSQHAEIRSDTVIASNSGYSLPMIADGANGCIDDTWRATPISPAAREYFTAVWTGTEMIVWGGYVGGGYNGELNTGGRYNPSTDSWTATSTANAPTPRYSHTAVWTGTEMIVWGGAHNPGGGFDTGGRYNPSTDSWTGTSTTDAPSRRYGHTAVWTGSEMIVWGGIDGYPSGGKYNPNTNSWTATATYNVPSVRYGHTAVWTGSEMIVWGGSDGSEFTRDPVTGGRYNPSTDSWTATSTVNVPAARYDHTAVWTGTEMIVWGGFNDDDSFYTIFNDGGRYNPSTDSWTATSMTNPPFPRLWHTAVWTGSEMIVWGGNPPTNTGGKYNPVTNNWTATSTTNAPSPRDSHTAVWTGSEMIIWGGCNRGLNCIPSNTGGRYCGQPPFATPTPTPGAPSATTNPATNIASFSATLNGTVNPNGSSTSVYFQYGPTTTYGATTSSRSYSGNTIRAVNANITGLTANTTYHFRIVATNSYGTRYGSDRTFTTLSSTGPPVVITNAATLIASFSATLDGSVDPHGLTTTVHFEYGTTTAYGQTTVNQSKSGNTFQNVAANISSLAASTLYHFRIVATNSAGTVHGSDRTFTTLSATGPPVGITNPATLIASFSATLNGSVDPHGLSTTVHFEYGTTTSYGLTTAPQNKSGNSYQNVSANISGLSASTTYHFRIVATNSAGTVYGADRTFTTLSPTGPPVVITNPATNLTSSSATLNGSVDPHGLSTSVHFQYGTTTSYGHTTPAQTHTGNAYLNVSANISGLTAGTRYHFRILATNSAGTSYGADKAFTP
jgi:N-acetylneuraminic acid mutarotase